MAWYQAHGRHSLPWRQTRDPYAVLVSEVMLQQTQVERVAPYYSAWLERWPSVASLADATPAQVIQQWSGLGYNRRAVSLLRAAKRVCELHGGIIPADEEPLRALPGVGGYTAGAIASFAYELTTPVLDTNIARAVARLCLGEATHRILDFRKLHKAAVALLPATGARDHNLAMMDLGAMICTAKSPACTDCPVVAFCHWQITAAAEPPRTGKTERFEDTARFARGRIVDALRIAPRSALELEGMLPEPHRPELTRYLEALQRDGLIEPAAERWQLAGFTAE